MLYLGVPCDVLQVASSSSPILYIPQMLYNSVVQPPKQRCSLPGLRPYCPRIKIVGKTLRLCHPSTSTLTLYGCFRLHRRLPGNPSQVSGCRFGSLSFVTVTVYLYTASFARRPVSAHDSGGAPLRHPRRTPYLRIASARAHLHMIPRENHSWMQPLFFYKPIADVTRLDYSFTMLKSWLS